MSEDSDATTPGAQPRTASLKALLALAPRKTAQLLALLVAVGLTEGVGVMLLVPLLGLVGLDVGTGTLGGLERGVAATFEALGQELTLEGVLLVYAGVVGLRLALGRWRAVATARLQAEATAGLQRELFAALVRTRWAELSSLRGASYVHALSDEAGRVGWALHTLALLASQAVIALVYGVLATLVAPLTVLLAIACGGGLLLVLRPFHRRTEAAGEAISRETSAFHGVAGEFLSGAKTIRAHGRESETGEAFANLTQQLAARQVELQTSGADAQALFEFGVVGVLCVLVLVSVKVLALSSAALLLVLFLFARTLRLAGSTRNYAQVLLGFLPAYDTLRTLQARCDAAAEDPGDPEGPPSPPLSLERELRLEGVQFSYPTGDAVLAGVDVVVAAGKITALVGASGGGKTTIADLAAGLLAPASGCVRVDGTALDATTRKAWRAQISYVTQEPFLFRDTLAANLRWASPEASDDDLREALEAADAWAFVAALPDGLQTPVGDRGQTLSGGQRQRLALARALLRKPALLLLDEATSELDTESEQRILAALERLQGRVTTLIIAHRLTTVRGADSIYVLEAGQVVEHGTWDALSAEPESRLSALRRAQGAGD